MAPSGLTINEFDTLDLLKLTASDVQEETFAGKSGLDSALKTLHDAEVQVKEIISDRFDKAVKSEDTASIERFFKLFPLINMHDQGLLKFTSYLCGKVVNQIFISSGFRILQ